MVPSFYSSEPLNGKKQTRKKLSLFLQYKQAMNTSSKPRHRKIKVAYTLLASTLVPVFSGLLSSLPPFPAKLLQGENNLVYSVAFAAGCSQSSC